MNGWRDVLDRGFPVTRRLCELPGFADFAQGRADSVERAHLGDWLVTVDAEALDLAADFSALFAEHLERTRDELGDGVWAQAA